MSRHFTSLQLFSRHILVPRFQICTSSTRRIRSCNLAPHVLVWTFWCICPLPMHACNSSGGGFGILWGSLTWVARDQRSHKHRSPVTYRANASPASRRLNAQETTVQQVPQNHGAPHAHDRTTQHPHCPESRAPAHLGWDLGGPRLP